MSITNVQLISDSLRLIGVVAEGQSVSPEQGDLALRVMNQLLEAWAVDGVDFGYFAQTSTTATCPIPAWSERGVTARLANALLAHYPSAQLSADMLDDDKNGVNVIRRTVHYQNREPLDMTQLGYGEGRGGRYNIMTDN